MPQHIEAHVFIVTVPEAVHLNSKRVFKHLVSPLVVVVCIHYHAHEIVIERWTWNNLRRIRLLRSAFDFSDSFFHHLDEAAVGLDFHSLLQKRYHRPPSDFTETLDCPRPDPYVRIGEVFRE